MTNCVIGALIGGGVGAFAGARRRRATGACRLGTSPFRGALSGALLGFLVVSAFAGCISDPAPPNAKQNATTPAHGAGIVAITTSNEFSEKVLHANVPVLVDLWASWCGPCREQLPIVDRIAENGGSQIRVVKINVDDANDLATSLNVEAIPTLIVFKDGKEQHRFVGVQSAGTLNRALGVS